MITLAEKLGAPVHYSLLLRKARAAGLHDSSALISLAVARGCQHYQAGPEPPPAKTPSCAAFSDEELAIALLSPSLPYYPRAVRVGAQMLGSRRNRPARLALLARRERAENVVRHVAAAGQQTEPGELFWQELLAALPPASPSRSVLPPGVLPHASRFCIEMGLLNPFNSAPGGKQRVMWLRPRSSSSVPT